MKKEEKKKKQSSPILEVSISKIGSSLIEPEKPPRTQKEDINDSPEIGATEKQALLDALEKVENLGKQTKQIKDEDGDKKQKEATSKNLKKNLNYKPQKNQTMKPTQKAIHSNSEEKEI